VKRRKQPSHDPKYPLSHVKVLREKSELTPDNFGEYIHALLGSGSTTDGPYTHTIPLIFPEWIQYYKPTLRDRWLDLRVRFYYWRHRG